MRGALPAFARLVGQGLSLVVLRRPRSALALAGFGAFLAAWTLGLLTFAGVDAARTPAPRQFDGSALWVHAGFGFALLAAAWASARILRRPAIWLTLATLVAIAIVPWDAGYQVVEEMFVNPRYAAFQLAASILTVLVLASIARTHWILGDGVALWRRAVATLVFGAILIVGWVVRTEAWFFYPAAEDDVPEESSGDPRVQPARPSSPASRARGRAGDPETLLGRQPAMVAAATAALAPQTPGHIDLYGLGFAGDGKEATFRNEVEYFGQLLPARFGAKDRTLQLINHPGTVARTPLATLANLRDALAGIGARMDAEEDVLLLFLTSHGSPDHYLSVDQPPLPLRQVHPADIRDALDDAGIRWRVIVVSACYSGGFIEALRDPRTLVITAARADRPSFGCGADSEIAWFGHAFLAEALNQTTDFREAYAIAARNVRARERENGDLPSQPQIWAGDLVDAKLAAWRAGVVVGDAVPFVPAVPSGNTPAGQE